MKAYGAEFGFLAVGVIFFVLSNIFFFMSRTPKVAPNTIEEDMSSDPLAQYIPVDRVHYGPIVNYIERAFQIGGLFHLAEDRIVQTAKFTRMKCSILRTRFHNPHGL